eukprot:scaffold16196_cov48-Phaeocystis_antarctica.AAC.1
MRSMFKVRSAARALPPSPPVAGPPRERYFSPPLPHAPWLPCFPACTPRPSSQALLSTSAGRDELQPAAELRHVRRHSHCLDERHVRRALRRACHAPTALQSGPLRVRATCARRCPTPSPAFRPAHLARHRTPLFRLGRAHPPCPPPTSCSSVAHGRAPRPSPLLAMTRGGLREAAREDRLCMCAHGETRSRHPAEHVRPPNRNLLRKCVGRLRKLFG